MLIASILAAAAMSAAPATNDAAPAAQPAATADAKPAMKRVCETVEVAGSNLPKRKCRDVPVKADDKVAQEGKKDAPKPE